MTEEKHELEWWEKPDQPEKPKPTTDELLARIEQMKMAQQSIPKALLFKQFIVLVYVVINIIFMYVSIKSPSAGYIAIYMVPLIFLLLDYFLVVGRLKKIAWGEKK